MGLCLVIVGVVSIFFLLVRWNRVRNHSKDGRLPPGRMGWPVIGQTPEFLKYGPVFMRNQRARHGNLFKTHIFGSPTVICMDEDLNRYILLNDGKGFAPGYPKSMVDILGEWNISAVPPSIHKIIRGSLLSLVNPVMIKDWHLKALDTFMKSHLQNWGGKILDIQEQTKEMAFLFSLQQVAGIQPGPVADALRPQFYNLLEGSLSLPINLPGTKYHLGLQARKEIFRVLWSIVEERKASPSVHEDMIGALLNEDGEKNRFKLTDNQIFDLLLTIIQSGFETVSTTSMMAVKFLHDNPSALEEIRKEHFAIQERKTPGEPLNWEDYKSMTFTRAVIHETLRLATVVNGVLRKTTRDMNLKGYKIPKGWKIYVYLREINFDPHFYPDPLTFNPWRWLKVDLEASSHFMMFGGGSRLCPGKELGTTQISVFLHHFVTNYRWEEVGGDQILKFPRVVAPNGLRIKVSEYCS